MKLRKIIQDYFSFSKSERIGIIVLVIIIAFLIAANQIIYSFEKPALADEKTFNEMLAKMKALEEPHSESVGELFPFDPNFADSVELMTLALPAYVKRNILSYRQHGGKFRNPIDLRKIYGMNDSLYLIVKPYIQIKPAAKTNPQPITGNLDEKQPSIRASFVSFTPDGENQYLVSIDLNHAVAEDLETLKGIGPVLSKRIVSYRNLLGGFAFYDQLNEVYGLPPEVIQENLNKLKIDTVDIKKIDLNFASVEELAKHPYINYKDARRIIEFRSKNGYISDKNILLTDSVIGIEKFQKLVFYLK